MTPRVQKDLWFKAVIWMLPIVFTSGMLAYMIQENAERVGALQMKMVEVDRASAVQGTTLSAHERLLDSITAEQTVIRQTVQDQAVDIAAICQATGARCR